MFTIKEFSSGIKDNVEKFSTEWLLTNRRGDFVFQTSTGETTRKYHALLTIMDEHRQRFALVKRLEEEIESGGQIKKLTVCDYRDGRQIEGLDYLKEFNYDFQIARYVYSAANWEIIKTIYLLPDSPTVIVDYFLCRGDILLRLRPLASLLNFYNLNKNPQGVAMQLFQERIICLQREGISVYLGPDSGRFIPQPLIYYDLAYHIERGRGDDYTENLFNPGYWEINLKAENPRWRLVISNKEIGEDLWKVSVPQLVNEKLTLGNCLKRSLKHFVVEDKSRDIYTIMAGYPWFTDWGRDTSIFLSGLRQPGELLAVAKKILLKWAGYQRNGLIPNFIPSGGTPAYNTIDASLWYVLAVYNYWVQSNDASIWSELKNVIEQIIAAYQQGTDFDIKMDRDGLIATHFKDFALTWMDARVGDWVVTPRTGKAVEIQALWYNVLRLAARFYPEQASVYGSLADKVYNSFNEKFINLPKKYLFDVVDGENGNEAAIRPNALWAISLPEPLLVQKYWHVILDTATTHLWTPYGLRTLSFADENFQKRYKGDILKRDAAYHQGTVWPYLLGSYWRVWRRVYPEINLGENKLLEKNLAALYQHMQEHGLGTIAEVFDAVEPHKPGGCFAQAWSVSEVLSILQENNLDYPR